MALLERLKHQADEWPELKGLWTGFKVKAMLDWWDWAPIARKINAGVIRRLKERVSRDQALRASDDSASQEKQPCVT